MGIPQEYEVHKIGVNRKKPKRGKKKVKKRVKGGKGQKGEKRPKRENKAIINKLVNH